MQRIWLGGSTANPSIVSLVLLLCLLCGSSLAQTITTVTGTVIDKNGIPYAGGTVQTQFVNVNGGASPTVTSTGATYIPPITPTTIAANGTFSLSLAANPSLSPSGTQWNFIICSPATPSTTPDPMLLGSQCFATGPITISGSTQSITSNINTVPPPSLASATILWAQSFGGTGLGQTAVQSVLTNGTGIAPGTSQAQPSITITGVTTNSVCYASPAGPVPASWLTGVQIGFVAVTTNTATPYLTNSTTGLVSPAGIQLNVKCIL